MNTHTESARVYVGTYAKYNSGSIAGAWLNLEDYSSRDEFLEAARQLHADESDPELMFQDFEGFPRSYYSESSIEAELWDWLALDDDEREIVEAYREDVNQDASIEEAREAYCGIYEDEAEWAEQFLEDTGDLNEIPERLRPYFDFEAYAYDADLNGDVHFVPRGGSVLVFFNR